MLEPGILINLGVETVLESVRMIEAVGYKCLGYYSFFVKEDSIAQKSAICVFYDESNKDSVLEIRRGCYEKIVFEVFDGEIKVRVEPKNKKTSHQCKSLLQNLHRTAIKYQNIMLLLFNQPDIRSTITVTIDENDKCGAVCTRYLFVTDTPMPLPIMARTKAYLVKGMKTIEVELTEEFDACNPPEPVTMK